MQLSIILLGILVAGASGQTNIIETGIRRFMEQFRLDMQCGFPNSGIGVLAPMQRPQIQASIDLGTLAFQGWLLNFRTPDLNTFQIRSVDFNMIFMRMDFDTFYPFINVNGQFAQGIGRAPGGCAISGSGQFQVRFNGVSIRMTTRMVVAGGTLQIGEMTTRVAVQSFNSNINQFVGTVAQSQQCNRVLEAQMPSIIAANQVRISAFFERHLRPIATNFIRGMTLQDLLNVITLPATPTPCRRTADAPIFLAPAVDEEVEETVGLVAQEVQEMPDAGLLV